MGRKNRILRVELPFPERIVKITWGDAWSDTTNSYKEHEFKEHSRSSPHVSIGLVLNEDNKGILLTSFYNSGREKDVYSFYASRATSFIPRGMIINIEELEPKETTNDSKNL